MLSQKIGKDVLTLDCGTVLFNGEQVGTVKAMLKHGYHPAILIDIDRKDPEWMEFDAMGEKSCNLFARIWELITITIE